MGSNTEFAKFIDDLRESRNMTREQLVNGIISERQYYRFLSGESSLKNDVIDDLFNKLEITHLEAYKYYNQTFLDHSSTTKTVREFLGKYKYKEAEELLNTINFDEINSKTEYVFLKLSRIRVLNRLKKIPYNLAAKEVINLINYPDVINNKFFSYNEMFGLDFLTRYIVEKKDFDVANAMYNVIMDNSDIANPMMDQENLFFYTSISKMFGLLEEYHKSITIANNAIELINSQNYIMNSLVFYVTKALGYKHLGNQEKVKENLLNVYMLLRLENKNEERYKVYEKFIKENFSYKESELIEFKI